MNDKTIIEFGFRMMWKIMQISSKEDKEYFRKMTPYLGCPP